MRTLVLALMLACAASLPLSAHDDAKAAPPPESPVKVDAERLAKLAADLREAVKKSNEHTLSLEVIHKADDIEQLAKKLKSEHKN